MGVSGSGKSTLARALHDRLGWACCEGDDLHAPASIARMAAGEALTDAERAPWLARIAAWIDGCVGSGASGIVTCSALRRAYRDVLRRPEVLFVWLDGPPDLLTRRLAARTGHYMPPSLLDSQLATLEPPGVDERSIRVDISLSLDSQVDAVVSEPAFRELRP